MPPLPTQDGLPARETEEAIRAQHGPEWQVAAIGPAGERLIPLATLSHDGRHAGRGGLGAVLGAKRIKAIACVSIPNCSPFYKRFPSAF